MERTLGLIVAGAVFLFSAAAITFIYGDSVGRFGEVSNSQLDGSQCELWKAESNTVNSCIYEGSGSGDPHDSVEEKAQDAGCEWAVSDDDTCANSGLRR